MPVGRLNFLKTFDMREAVMDDYISMMEAGMDVDTRRECIHELFEEYCEFLKKECGKKRGKPLTGEHGGPQGLDAYFKEPGEN